VADALIKDGYNADALHGDLSQAQRDFVMKRYRSRSLQMLVATDVAARGIDVNDVTHVINYNLPDEIESYTHRSGRTARAGKSGVSIAIIHSKELHKIREIEKIIKRKFAQAQIPTGFDVCEQQLMALVKRIHNVEVDEKTVERYLPQVFEELQELSREDIIKRFVSIEFNRFAEYYRNAPDLNHNAQRDDRRALAPGVVKLYMNIGGIDGFDFNTIKEFIAENAEINTADITWTDLKNTFSLIEVKNEAVVFLARASAAKAAKVAAAVDITRAEKAASTARSHSATAMEDLRRGRRKVIGSRYEVLGDRCCCSTYHLIPNTYYLLMGYFGF